MSFFSMLALYPPRADLVLIGEFDAFEAAQLRPRLAEAVDGGCCQFSLDASQVSFVDAGALGELVRLRNEVARLDGTVEVMAASPRFRWVAGLAGLGAAFGLDRLPAPPPPSTRNGRGRDRGSALQAR